MNPPEQDREDSEAALRVLRGEREAFGALVARYQGPVYRLMLRFTRDAETAAELSQETFLRAFQRLALFDPKRRFFPWLYALALNLARDHARRSPGRFVPLAPDADVELQAAGDCEPARAVDATRIKAALRDLPEGYREALALRYLEDFSLQEVAQAMDLTLSGAKMRVHRGLAMLRKRFGEEEP